MKKLYNYLLGIFFILCIVSCNVTSNVSNPISSTSLQNSIADNLAESENLTGKAFSISGATFLTETIGTTEYRVLTISFTNGEVDLTTSNLAKISLYQLSDAASGTEIFERASTAMSYSYFVYTPTASGFDGGDLKLYYADGTINSLVELVVLNTITADNGAKKINQDGDAFVGADNSEENADIYFQELASPATTLNTPTVLTTGISRNTPQSTFTVTDNGYDNGTGIVRLTISGANLNAFTNTSLIGNFSAQSFSYSTMTWSDLSINSSSYNSTTGELTIQLNILDNGTPYRYKYSKYEMKQSTATEGYIRRGSHNNYVALTKVNNVVDTGSYFSTGSITISKNTEKGNSSVDIAFAGMSGDIISSTLTSSSVRVFVTPSSGERTKETFNATITEIADNEFRFILDNQLYDLSSASVDVELLPTIQCDNGTPETTSDDLYFGNPAAGNGLAMITNIVF